MKIELAKSSEVIADIAELFRRELEQKDIYGTVYTSPKLDNFLMKLSLDRVDEFLTITDSGVLLGAMQFRVFPNALHINNIAVSSSHHNRGIGSKLILWIIRRASDFGLNVTLDVSLNNKRAISWYKRIGFLENSLTSKLIFLCDGLQSMNRIVVFDSLSNLNDYGFSEARLSTERISRFFCILDRFIRLKSGYKSTIEEIIWFKKNFNGYLIVNSECIEDFSTLQPFFIQSSAKMELKCG